MHFAAQQAPPAPSPKTNQAPDPIQAQTAGAAGPASAQSAPAATVSLLGPAAIRFDASQSQGEGPIRIVGADKAGPEAQDAIRLLARSIDKHGASDRGGDLEVSVRVEG